MFGKWFSRGVAILVILVFFAGCSTMMHVNAVDQHGMPVQAATVLVDNAHIGITPHASTQVSNFIASEPRISVSAEGFHPTTVAAQREVKVGALVVGIFLWPTLLWVWGPRAQQNVMLTPVQ